MSRYARFKVFSIVYGVAYMGLFLYSELYQVAMFRYYPVLGRFYREAMPLETAGPPILWYSWLFGAAVISLALSARAREGGRNGWDELGLGRPGRAAAGHPRVRAPVVLLTSSW